MSIQSVMPSSHLILCRPLLLLPPIPPSIGVFPNESVLRIRWPKYWSFSFNISPSNEYLGLISFRILLGLYFIIPIIQIKKKKNKIEVQIDQVTCWRVPVWVSTTAKTGSRTSWRQNVPLHCSTPLIPLFKKTQPLRFSHFSHYPHRLELYLEYGATSKGFE